MWASLQRAGNHFTDEARLEERPNSKYEVLLGLRQQLPQEMRSIVVEYIKSYAEASGWAVEKVRVTRYYVFLRASSSPSSSLGKKPSAKPAGSSADEP